MHVLARLSEILFPFPLPVWVSQRDQLCLPFTCLGYVSMCTCVSVCLCVHVSAHTCACAGRGVGEAREIATLPHWIAMHCPSHSFTSQKTTRSWNTAGTESEASPESHMRWLSMLFSRYYEACLLAQWASEITFLTGSYQQTAKRRNIFFFFSCLNHEACGILVPLPGIKSGPSAVIAWSPNHWTTKGFRRRNWI